MSLNLRSSQIASLDPILLLDTELMENSMQSRSLKLITCLFGCLLLAFFSEASNFGQEVKTETSNKLSPKMLWKLGRLGEAAVSPDGSQVVFTVRRYELADDKGHSSLHAIALADGSEKVLLEKWSSIGSPQWIGSGDDAKLFIEGAPAAEGDEDAPSPQAWVVDAASGATTVVTDVEDGIANLKVSPDGSRIAFTLDIKLDKTVNELYDDLPKADARIIDGLMYRHWNAWHDYKYSHLHVGKIVDGKMTDPATDLMEGIKADCPVPPFGGSEQFTWSPDSKEIAYTLKVDPKWAESTDSNIYVVNVDNGESRNVTQNNKGYDRDPAYSPDGKYLAFQSMQRAGFESDRNRIMVMDRSSGDTFDLTQGLDQNANGIHWSADSKKVVFASEYRGSVPLFEISLDAPGACKRVSDGDYNLHAVDVLADGKTAVVTRMNMLRPKELVLLNMEDKTYQPLSHINDEIFKGLELPTIKQRMVKATDGKEIQCWVIYPPGFDESADKQWPLITYCQGGPQGQIGQSFSYRWNFHLMAANGYVVVAPNRRGLPGFGRQWNDQISGDWGGQAMKDILSATDSMLAENWIDKKRAGAVGASFGGYTVYWLMGNHADRFQTMIAHCGVFNLESMYGSTEELFFVNWDLGGPYWKGPEARKKYDDFSPHRFVKGWSTPLLVIHGQKDFRVPVTQGMEAFTAAQVNDVPSRFLYFPEEGHWVQKPQNGVLWHRVFFDWLDRSLKKK